MTLQKWVWLLALYLYIVSASNLIWLLQVSGSILPWFLQHWIPPASAHPGDDYASPHGVNRGMLPKYWKWVWLLALYLYIVSASNLIWLLQVSESILGFYNIEYLPEKGMTLQKWVWLLALYLYIVSASNLIWLLQVSESILGFYNIEYLPPPLTPGMTTQAHMESTAEILKVSLTSGFVFIYCFSF
jgi:hypothetical protein